MNVRYIGLGLAVLQLATSATLYGVFCEPWRWFQVANASGVVQVAMFMASLLFILLPVAAVAGIWLHLRFGWYALCGYPVIAWIFGTVPIPFASFFYSADIGSNSIGITVVNTLAVAIGVVLLKKRQERPNQALQTDKGNLS